jgi:hypothetical protein
MKTEVNIDTLLAKDTLNITVKGKVYTITDVDLSVFLEMSSVDASSIGTIVKQLAVILNVPEEEISGIGIRAAMRIIKEICNWAMASESTEETAKGVNP